MTELEGSDPGDRVIEHLAGCRHCMAVYTELVRARAGFLVQPHPDMPTADLLERAKAIPSASEARRARGAARSDGRRLAPAFAVLTLGVALVVVWRVTGFEPRFGVPREVQQRIEERLREDSQGGLLYRKDLLPQPRRVRGAEAEATGSDLDVLQQAYAARQSAENAYWLIAGLLAQNQLTDADGYLRQSLPRFSTEARFHNLAAIYAYKRSDLPVAERELGAARALESDPAVLVNLAQVLQEQAQLLQDPQRAAEAQDLWAEVLKRFPEDPIAGLARQRSMTAPEHPASR